MNIHFVIHEAFEGPGALALWAQDRGHRVSTTLLYEHAPLITSVDEIDMLIVMGGPQSPATTQRECPYFDSLAEQKLIRKAIGAGKAVLGICLGAQLIGAALGAPHEPSPKPEIGKYPITLTPAGLGNINLAAFGTVLEVGHWHSDMPGLTSTASILAFSAGCPRQIVQYAPLVFGFQCHMEFTSDLIEQLINVSKAELRTLSEEPFVQQPERLRAHDYREMNARMFTFLDSLAEQISTGQHRRRPESRAVRPCFMT